MSGDAAPLPGDERLTVGEALIRLLERHGVDTVFGIPGVHTIELYRGLAASDIRHVTPRHEQGAAFMADGYARTSGRPGVCLLITGPGLTNAITGMAQARADRVPMLVVSGVNRTATLGRGEGHLHELPDQSALVATVALATRTLTDPGDLADALDEAFAIMSGPRPGPVHLEIPVDVMGASVDWPVARPETGLPDGRTLSTAGAHDANIAGGEGADASDADIAWTVAACRRARRPLILAGGGCARAAVELRRLAERLDAPVVTTVNARGVMADHPLDVPASPSLDSVRALVAASDPVIVIGTETGPTDYDMYERGPMPAPARWLRVDTDPAALAREPRATRAVRSDAARFAARLVVALDTPVPSETAGADDSSRTFPQATAAEARDERTAGGDEGADEDAGAARAAAVRQAARREIGAGYLSLLEAVDAVWRVLPDATIVGDSTQPIYAGNLYVEAPRPRAWFNSATGYGTLGYAPPAAVGAWLGEPTRPVVCLVGDGGLQFSLAELGSARDIDADVAFVVWNSAGYLEIERAMTDADITPVGVAPSPPDFVAVAGAYALPARRVQDVVALASALVELPRPCLIEFDARAR